MMSARDAWVMLAFAACGESSKPGGDVADSAPDAIEEASPEAVDDVDSATDTAADSAPESAPDTTIANDSAVPADTAPTFACNERPAVVPTTAFFADISRTSGIQVGNYITDAKVAVPINDHSRLAFADLNGDGYDDIVAHSLFPNPQAGVPFEHLVFLNNHDGTFSDASSASGLRDVQAGFFAFGDVDNDGDLDCFAGLDAQEIPDGDHGVFLNDGAAHFTRVANPGIKVPQVPGAVGNAVFADFDNDAILDLYLGVGQTSYAGKDFLFRGNGDGTFSNITARLVGNQSLQSNGSVTCDFDNDGDVDIIVSTYGVSTGLGHNLLWQNDGSGNFSEVAEAKGYAAQSTGNYWLATTGRGKDDEPNATSATWVGDNGFGVDCDDIDNDGFMDIFQTAISHPVSADYSRKWSDPTQLLMNLGPTGDFAFENRFLAVGLPFNEGDVDGAVIDFDNDGRLDLSLSRDSKYEASYTKDDQKGWLGLMRQKPDGTFESLGVASGANDLTSRYSASLTACTDDTGCTAPETCLFGACRNACSDDDQCSSATGESCGAFWNATTKRTQRFCRPLVAGKGAQNHAWSDIDHDGDLDLLIGGRDRGGGRPNFLFRNEVGQGNRSLAIHVKGDGIKVNRDGIGTRLVLVATSGEPAKRQMREVQGSRGMYNGMDGMTQYFGLGDFPCGYTLEVRWPDGTTAAFQSGTFPEAHITLTYPDKLSF